MPARGLPRDIGKRRAGITRAINMTIPLAFLAPNLVKAAIEGRLPRGIGIERLRDPPIEWSRTGNDPVRDMDGRFAPEPAGRLDVKP